VRAGAVVFLSLVAIAAFLACSGGGSSSGPSGSDGGKSSDGAGVEDAAFVVDSGDATPGSTSGDAADALTQGTTDATHEAAGACVPPPTPDAGICNPLGVTGAPVPIQCAGTQKPPTPSGGTIADGTYVLTSSTYYGTCPQPEQDRITWSVCGDTWQTAQESTINGQKTVQVVDAMVTQSGMNLSIHVVCGPMQTLTFGYDATPTTLTLFTWAPTSAPMGRVDVFARQ
jgi:hypothetical protein